MKQELKRKSAGDLVLYSKKVSSSLKLNAATFPNLPILMKDFDLHIDDLEKAQVNTFGGAVIETAIRDEKRAKIESDLRLIGYYVAQVANGNKVIIQSAGMTPKSKNAGRVAALSTPANLMVSTPKSAQADLKWNKVDYARTYQVEICEDITGEIWKPVAHSTAGKTKVTHLKEGSKYWFRVKALGTQGMDSNYSSPVSVIIQ